MLKAKPEYLTVGRCLIVRVNGDLDHYRADEIRKETDFYLYRGNIKYVIFDMEGVDFCDSSGIGLVMGRYKKVRLIQGTVALVQVGHAASKIFKAAGVYRVIDSFATTNQALFEYQNQAGQESDLRLQAVDRDRFS